jgi:hypothetical protein
MVKKASVEDDFDDALKDAPPVYAPTTKKEPAPNQPNGGGEVPQEVPPQEGTQVRTPQGTSGGTSSEGPKDDSLDFSLDGMLSETIDPEVDWRKAGWSAKRYRKRAVEILVDLRWKGYRTEQELVDAALAAFLPDQVQDKARQKALRGEL